MAVLACWIYFRFTLWYIFKIRKTKCVRIPNFVQIGKYIAKLWRFVHFQDGFRPPSWILKNSNFWKIFEDGVKICVGTPNLVKIGWSAVEILRQNLNPISPPCWIYSRFTFGHIFKIRKTKCVRIPNFVQIGQYLAKLWHFVYFQDGFRPPSWILKN